MMTVSSGSSKIIVAILVASTSFGILIALMTGTTGFTGSSPRIVSADPLLHNLTRKPLNLKGTDTIATSNVSTRVEAQIGPWSVDGWWFTDELQRLRNFTEGFSMHPWSPDNSPSTARPSTLSQNVTLPNFDSLTAYIVARNGVNRLEYCTDSRIQLYVSPVDSEEFRETETILNQSLETITLDISDYRGTTVTMRTKARKADAGCNEWRDEFSNIQAFFIAGRP